MQVAFTRQKHKESRRGVKKGLQTLNESGQKYAENRKPVEKYLGLFMLL